MAIVVTERVGSRDNVDGESPFQNRTYVVTGTNDEDAATVALGAAIPVFLSGLTRKDYGVEPIGDPILSEQWTGHATYGPSDSGSAKPAAEGSNYLSFDTGSSSVHITQSLSTEQSASIASTATDRGRAINSSKEGTDGVDIIAPEFRFSTTQYFAYDYVDSAYIDVLAELAGTVNNATFDIFPAGEVLFINAAGNRRGTDQSEDGWEITFNFAVQKTIVAPYTIATGVTFTSDIEGWDYVWGAYRGKPDATTKIRTSKMFEAYVERVYARTNFALLGI